MQILLPGIRSQRNIVELNVSALPYLQTVTAMTDRTPMREGKNSRNMKNVVI